MKLKLIIWGVLLLIVVLFFVFIFFFGSLSNKSLTNKDTNTTIQNEKIDVDMAVYNIISTFYNDNLSLDEKIGIFEEVCTKDGLTHIKASLGYSDEAHSHEYKKPSDEVKYEMEVINLNTYTKEDYSKIYSATFFELNIYINDVKNTSSYLWKCEFINIDNTLYLEDISIS